MAATPTKPDGDRVRGGRRIGFTGTTTAAVVVVALAFQFQPTVALGDLTLRLSLSDIFVVLLSPVFVLLLIQHRGELRQAAGPYLIVPVAATTVIMTFGLLTGIAEADGMTRWALVKYIGWYSLFYYALIGILLTAHDPPRLPRIFVVAFVSALSVIIVTYLIMSSLGMYWSSHSGVRLTGFMQNANAFGLSVVCGIALVVANGETLFERRWRLGWEPLAALLCAGLLFTRSVAAALALLAIALCFLAARRQYLSTIRIGLMAGVIYVTPGALNKLMAYLLPPRLELPGRFGLLEKIGGIVSGERDLPGNMYGLSLNARIESNAKALSAWLEQPILGIGLGSFWERQQQSATEEQPAMVIHNTALWLLTEFGIVGLAVFAGLFISFGLFLYRAMVRNRDRDPPRADFIFAGLLIMAGWATMSLAHELMYQRIPWFILGMCASVALAPNSAPNETNLT